MTLTVARNVLEAVGSPHVRTLGAVLTASGISFLAFSFYSLVTQSSYNYKKLFKSPVPGSVLVALGIHTLKYNSAARKMLKSGFSKI